MATKATGKKRKGRSYSTAAGSHIEGNSPSPNYTGEGNDQRWWRLDKPMDRANALYAKSVFIRQRQRWRKSMNIFHSRLYDGAIGLFTGSLAIGGPEGEYDPQRLPFNVIKSGIDTLVSMLSKNRPLPQVVTSGASVTEEIQAKMMTRAIEGELTRARFWKMRPDILRDACIFGTGITYQYRTQHSVCIERVLETEILVDRADGIRGDPRCQYWCRTVDRFVLAEKYGDPDMWGGDQEKADKMRNAILNAPMLDHNEHEFVWLDDSEDRLLVVEGWHLPDNSNDLADYNPAKPVGGWHCMAISGVEDPLIDEPWEKPYFPFAVIRKQTPVAGWYGTGLAQEMAGFQSEINAVADKVQTAHHLMGGGHIFVPQGCEITDADITNGIGMIIKYKGQKPEWHSPTPVAAETYGYLKDLPQFALQFAGIPAMTAQAEPPPPGVTAARALMFLDEVHSGRFQVFGRADEEWVMEISRQIVDLVAEIAADDPAYAIKVVAEGRRMKKIIWKQYALDRDAYVLQVFPTSLLGRTPAARLQYVQDLFNAKVIDRAMFLKLLDAPDVNQEMDLEAAGRQVAEEQIEHMLLAKPTDKDAFQGPDMYQDLVYSMHRCQAQLNHWKLRGLQPFNRKLLSRYIVACRRLLRTALQDIPQPTVPPAGSPQGEAALPAPMTNQLPAPGQSGTGM